MLAIAESQLVSPQSVTIPPSLAATEHEVRPDGPNDSQFLFHHPNLKPTNVLVAASRPEASVLVSGLGDLRRISGLRPERKIRIALHRREPQHESTLLVESMIRQLLAHENIAAARKLLRVLPSSNIEGQSLQRLRVLLSEPRLRRRSAPRPGGSADLTWLAQNASAYKGRWVAVSNGALLDSDVSLEVLMKRLQYITPDVTPLFHLL